MFVFFNLIVGGEFSVFGRITVRIPLTFLVSSELRQSASEDICLKVLQDHFSEAPFFFHSKHQLRRPQGASHATGSGGRMPCSQYHLLLCSDFLGQEAPQ